MSSDEFNSLPKEKRFSIFTNDNNQHKVYLGPGSFLNHDCESNSEYNFLGSKNTVGIKTKRNINAREEITVFYGKHYFGPSKIFPFLTLLLYLVSTYLT